MKKEYICVKNAVTTAFFTLYKTALLLFVCFSTLLQGQNIQGKITNENGDGLPANVILKKNNSPIDFKITDASGEFIFNQISKIQHKDSLKLEVRSHGYQTVIEDFVYDSNEDYNFHFVLSEPIVALEDIFVEAKRTPIKLKKDTVEYNAESFKDGSERVIEDLLKKLPGVRVEEDGKIKFKGKEISKFLLEGDDLFDRNYRTGTRNISVDVVDKIQAIENYSENYLLKDIENSNKVAMNIILKPGMADFSGDVTLGYGLKDRYDNKVNAIILAKDHKNFTTASYNNIGQNYSPYNYIRNHAAAVNSELGFLSKTEIIQNKISGLDINENRQSLNNAWFANTNHIYRLNENFYSRLIFNFFKDEIQFKKETYSKFFLSNNDYLERFISESVVKKPIHFNPQLKLTWKNDKNTLIETDLEYAKEEIHTTGNLRNNFTDDIFSDLKTSNHHAFGKFNITNKLNDNQAIDLQAIAADVGQKSNFYVNPSFDFHTGEIRNDPLLQEVERKKSFFQLKGNLLGALNSDQKYEVSYTTFYQNESLFSKLQNENDVFELNELSLKNWSSKIQLKYHIDLKRLQINPSINLLHNHISYRQQTDSVFDIFIIAPNLDLSYKIGRYSSIFLSGNYEQNLIPIENLYKKYILTNFRDFQRFEGNLFFQKSFNNSIGYNFNNYYSHVGMLANIFYTKDQNQFLMDYEIRPNSSLLNNLFYAESTTNIGVYGMMEKLVMPIESKIRFTTTFTRVEALNRVNESEIRNNFINIWDTELFLKSAFDVIFNFDNVFTYKQMSLDADGDSQFNMSGWNNQFNTYWKFNKKWFFMTTWDWYKQDVNQDSQNHFIDLNLRYQKNATFEITLKAVNLLNTNNFIQSSFTDVSTYLSKQKLNERYVMILMKFRF